MSFAVRRPVANPPSSGVGGHGHPPPQPTTAPVLDFICLFTHDLRRKQKRWQDGRLKYHTFNRRVMVYDERGNFIGDAHWPTGAGDLDEGEELELDRGAAIVQVAECAGVREQDLSEVLDRRVRDVERRRAEREARTPGRTTPRGDTTTGPVVAAAAARVATERQQPQTHFQLNHRPLSAIVPSPGPLGRATVPLQSPFEVRRRAEGENVAERPEADAQRGAKRQRLGMPTPPSKAGYAQSLFGTRLTLSACPSSSAEALARVRALKERTNLQGRSQDLQDKDQRSVRDVSGDPVGDVVMLEQSARDTLGKSPHFTAPATRSVPQHREAAVAVGTLAQTCRQPRQAIALHEPQNVQANATTSKPRQALSNISERQHPVRNTRISSTPVDLTGDDEDLDIDTPVPREPVRSKVTSLPARKGKEENSKQNNPQNPRKRQGKPSGSSSPDKQNDAVSRPPDPRAPPKEKGPRAELRIRSRQRRGLLMVAERKQQADRSRSSKTPDSSGVSAKAGPLDRTAKPAEPPRGKRQPAEVTPEPERIDMVSEDEAAAPGAGPDSATDVEHSEDGGLGPVFAESSSESDAPAMRRRKQQKKGKASKLDDEASSVEGDGASIHGSQGEDTCAGSSHRSNIASPRPTRQTRRRKIPSPDPFDDDSDDDPSPPRTKRRKETRTQGKTAATSDDKPAPSGPRIAKMARRSLKSREIIGFVVSDNAVPLTFAAATGRIDLGSSAAVPPTCGVAAHSAVSSADVDATSTAAVSAPTKSTMHPHAASDDSTTEPTPLTDRDRGLAPSTNQRSDIAENARDVEQPAYARAGDPTSPPVQAQGQLEEAGDLAGSRNAPQAAAGSAKIAAAGQTNPSVEQSNNSVATAAPKPRILNPATRGKKAARREDAAGHAPQSLVPLEPPAAISVRPRAIRAAVVDAGSETRKGADMPGFSKANGGAWSKHAEDLLGMARPTGRR
ncbi:hypothetical protein JDV02_008195 [Purpureocillium takamizusanense]|uniref:5'-3' DNA helicase ZGRF1-like N-terminal domain-containing protein n=1 Tax=Purpureocillium takamizusanense TaxID=2060973 RepID=A0A9Q8VD26_9HYPO|nr:uncharacterized protein JDV02_008195 [Purpureocillium takamizusanense]UNI22295.1 hypothetical protein JDV02_008195 [Purpureocillium takamizusanense]